MNENTQEYLPEPCIYCAKNKLTITDTIPQGRERMQTGTYLKCQNCKNIMIMPNFMKTKIQIQIINENKVN